MSFHVFFSLSTGLSKSIPVPPMFLREAIDHINHVEKALGFNRYQYLNNPVRWQYKLSDIPNKLLCKMAVIHNEWVRQTYHNFCEWSQNPPSPHVLLTPEQAQSFWHGLKIIDVPLIKWTPAYFDIHKQHIFKVLTTGENDGTSLDTDPLTSEQARKVISLFTPYLKQNKTAHWGEGEYEKEMNVAFNTMTRGSVGDKEFGANSLSIKQAAQIIIIYSGLLDHDDIRLDVPYDCDFLVRSDDYCWCSKCGRCYHHDDVYYGANFLKWCKSSPCEIVDDYELEDLIEDEVLCGIEFKIKLECWQQS